MLSLIASMQACNMQGSITSLNVNFFHMQLSRPQGCQRIFTPTYAYVFAGDQPIFRFVLHGNATETSLLRQTTPTLGMDVVVKCNPQFKDDCPTMISRIASDSMGDLTLTIEVTGNYVDKLANKQSITEKVALPVPVALIQDPVSISLVQDTVLMNITVSTAPAGLVTLGFTCRMAVNPTNATTADLVSVTIPASPYTFVEGKNMIQASCPGCLGFQIHTCDVTLNSSIYYDCGSQLIANRVSTSSAPVLTPIILVVVAGAILLGFMYYKRTVKNQKYRKPVHIDRKLVSKAGSSVATRQGSNKESARTSGKNSDSTSGRTSLVSQE
ncbi:Conserved_hypothetical protein [Hexamita inflata]|uniref:Uncharacterized protein n=1 Tax=Hexamita inflata TaxID=28002 RepID=A0AA86TY34_9EUKA|nr:Conserved hypothetical protein [Hexamita inflata]